MSWKELTVNAIAKKYGINAAEVREKQRLVQKIIKARKNLGMSQAQLAKKIAVTQGRIAQIESGIGSQRTSFDVLLHILMVLGYEFRIISRKAA